jgi:hypothetical protein
MRAMKNTFWLLERLFDHVDSITKINAQVFTEPVKSKADNLQDNLIAHDTTACNKEEIAVPSIISKFRDSATD